jgi:hypothetical protein
MSFRRIGFALVSELRASKMKDFHQMSSKAGRGRKIVKSESSKPKVPQPPKSTDPWVEVLDKASGQTYFWNQTTDETTALGAPKPTDSNRSITTPAGPEPGMMSGLGGMVAQGFAFGVGSSIGHSVVGSMFGGSSSSGESSGGGDSGGSSDFDI